MNIVESEYCREQFRFPRTKKRRIRNKWAKRPENFRPSRKGLVLGDTLLVHPVIAAAIRRQVLMDGEAGLLCRNISA